MDLPQLVTDVQSSLLPVLNALLNHLNISPWCRQQRQYPIFQNGEN